VFDTLFGVCIFFAVLAMPDLFITYVNNAGKILHLEQLEEKIKWLIGKPAGFKPN
jgi:hypothetical protein